MHHEISSGKASERAFKEKCIPSIPKIFEYLILVSGILFWAYFIRVVGYEILL